MSANAVLHISAPQSASLVASAALHVHRSTGPMNVIVLNKPEYDKNQTVKAGYDAVVQIQQYISGAWANVGSAVTVKPGGQQNLAFRVGSTKVRIQTRGVNGSPGLRLDVQHNGKPFLGQIDILLDLPTKAGYSTLGDTTAGMGADPAPSAWPA